MKPRKVTAEREAEERLRMTCDMIVDRAARMMVEEMGASIGMMLDRMLTYAAAQACTIDGSPKTATAFRHLADNIEGGVFHSVTGEDRPSDAKH